MYTDVFYSSSPEILTNYTSSFQTLTAENFPLPSGRIPEEAKFGSGGIGIARASFPFAFMYNTNKVKPAEVPKSWSDLTDAKWKGEDAAVRSPRLGDLPVRL